MAKTLVIVAHPDIGNSRINAAWINALSDLPDVTVHDLYENYPCRVLDIELEQGLVDQHDRIVLQFPFQWYSCPPLLKQWLDEVFTSGWAYGPGGHALEGKTLAIAVSTFSRAADYQRDSRYGRNIEDLTSPFEVTALRVGMRYQPGFFLHSSSDYSDAELSESAQQYRAFIAQGY
ncbi:NAD(P)H-dependent oxidoreductase [Pseudomonas putida]